MLDKKRIDFASVHFPEVLLSYKQLDISHFPQSTLKFQVTVDAIACTGDKSDWIEDFDQVIHAMYDSNQIQSLLGPAYTGR